MNARMESTMTPQETAGRRRGQRRRFPGIVTIVLAAGLCAGRASGTEIATAGSGYWTNGSTWVGGVVPGAADTAVILNGHTITNSDAIPHDVGSLTIASGGVLTHTANSSTEAYKLILNIASNLTIDAGGQINVTGKGYARNNGPGAPTSSSVC